MNLFVLSKFERNAILLIPLLAVKLLTMGLLGIAWLMLFQKACRVDSNEAFHVAMYNRDLRKARFYQRSAWFGLAAAFLSILSLDIMANFGFDSTAVREIVLGLTRVVGVWGLLIVALVLSQVNNRIAQVNSDGRSLLPIPQDLASKHDNNNKFR